MKKAEMLKELISLEIEDQRLTGNMMWEDDLDQWATMDSQRYDIRKKISLLRSKLNKKKVI